MAYSAPTGVDIDSDTIYMRPRLLLYTDWARMGIITRALFPIVLHRRMSIFSLSACSELGDRANVLTLTFACMIILLRVFCSGSAKHPNGKQRALNTSKLDTVKNSVTRLVYCFGVVNKHNKIPDSAWSWMGYGWVCKMGIFLRLGKRLLLAKILPRKSLEINFSLVELRTLNYNIMLW